MEELARLLGLPHSALHAHPFFTNTQIPDMEWIAERGYLSFPDRGISLVCNAASRISAVQLYAEGRTEGFVQWAGPLPKMLSFGTSRSGARLLLGVPIRSGEKQDIPILGPKPAWDSFHADGVVVNLEYRMNPESGIQLISVRK
jgi:hypothetical protein